MRAWPVMQAATSATMGWNNWVPGALGQTCSSTYRNWVPGEPNWYSGVEGCAIAGPVDWDQSQPAKWWDVPCGGMPHAHEMRAAMHERQLADLRRLEHEIELSRRELHAQKLAQRAVPAARQAALLCAVTSAPALIGARTWRLHGACTLVAASATW